MKKLKSINTITDHQLLVRAPYTEWYRYRGYLIGAVYSAPDKVSYGVKSVSPATTPFIGNMSFDTLNDLKAYVKRLLTTKRPISACRIGDIVRLNGSSEYYVYESFEVSIFDVRWYVLRMLDYTLRPVCQPLMRVRWDVEVSVVGGTIGRVIKAM